MPSDLIFERATLRCYRLFDIADEIDLERARQVLSADSRRIRLSREGSKYIELPNPPLGVELGRRALQLVRSGTTVEVFAEARMFDHGAVSVRVDYAVPAGMGIDELVPIADELYDSEQVDALCLDLSEQLRVTLQGAIQGSHHWEQSESYTVLFCQSVRTPTSSKPSAAEILRVPGLAALMLGERHDLNLSERESSEVLQHSFSYTEEDLVIIDWNAAFVYEPSGSPDIPDILEIANAQLLEFRYYDAQLDQRLATIYAELERKKRTWAWTSLFLSPYRRLARRTLASVLEISEFVERAENSLKVIGDVYLAKVYEAASEQFRVPAWQQSVTRKQGLIAQVYGLLKGEIDTDRALSLEAAIVLLIILEIVLAFLKVF